MRTGIILDTDIGYDADDLIALLLLLRSPEVQVALVITGDEVEGKRALFARQILDLLGRTDIRVVQGADLGNKNFLVDDLLTQSSSSIQTEYRMAVQEILNSYDRVLYVGIQAFSNLANIIREFPSYIHKLDVYQMGGSLRYTRRPGWVEHNVRIDVEAARYVLSSQVAMHLVVADTTFNDMYLLHDGHPIFQKLEESKLSVHRLLLSHLKLFHKATGFWSLMHDPLTVTAALGKDFIMFDRVRVTMDAQGNISESANGREIYISRHMSKAEECMVYLEERLFGR